MSKCIICFDDLKFPVMYGCCSAILCRQCAQKINECPQCRQPSISPFKDWNKISKSNFIFNHDFMIQYREYLEWDIVSEREDLTPDFIQENSDLINWNRFTTLDYQILDEFSEQINWALMMNTYRFSSEFIRRYSEHMIWNLYLNDLDEIETDTLQEFSHELLNDDHHRDLLCMSTKLTTEQMLAFKERLNWTILLLYQTNTPVSWFVKNAGPIKWDDFHSTHTFMHPMFSEYEKLYTRQWQIAWKFWHLPFLFELILNSALNDMLFFIDNNYRLVIITLTAILILVMLANFSVVELHNIELSMLSHFTRQEQGCLQTQFGWQCIGYERLINY